MELLHHAVSQFQSHTQAFFPSGTELPIMGNHVIKASSNGHSEADLVLHNSIVAMRCSTVLSILALTFFPSALASPVPSQNAVRSPQRADAPPWKEDHAALINRSPQRADAPPWKEDYTVVGRSAQRADAPPWKEDHTVRRSAQRADAPPWKEDQTVRRSPQRADPPPWKEDVEVEGL